MIRSDLRNLLDDQHQSLLLVIAGPTQKELARQVKLPKRITIAPKERHRLVRFAQKLGGKVLAK